jgi:dihydrofolate reductase
MSKLVVIESLSLDGVMQAPGRPDEDLRDGFARGGWALPYRDSVMGQAMAEGMAEGGPLLFGRRTYEDFFKVWPARTNNPFTAVLDAASKFVASTTLKPPLPWKNSALLSGDAAAAVTRLKGESARDIVVLGSGQLVGSLMGHDLVDEYVLLIHPLVLGSGRRLFRVDGPSPALALVDAKTTTTGVVIARYRPSARAADPVGRTTWRDTMAAPGSTESAQ